MLVIVYQCRTNMSYKQLGAIWGLEPAPVRIGQEVIVWHYYRLPIHHSRTHKLSHTHNTFTPTDNLEFPVHPTYICEWSKVKDA